MTGYEHTQHTWLYGETFFIQREVHTKHPLKRLILSIIIQIPRRIHRAFLSCGIFSIQYFCAVQVHRCYDYCLVICFPQWTRIPRVPTVPFTYVHLASGTTAYLKYTMTIATFVWPMDLALQPELNVWWFINNSIIITSTSESRMLTFRKIDPQTYGLDVYKGEGWAPEWRSSSHLLIYCSYCRSLRSLLSL